MKDEWNNLQGGLGDLHYDYKVASMGATHDVIYINIYHFEVMSSIHMGYTCEVS